MLLWTMLRPLIPYLAILVGLGVVYGYGHHNGASKQKVKDDKQFELYQTIATKRATDLSLLWNEARQRADDAADKQTNVRTQQAVALDHRAATLGAVSGIRFGDDAIRLFNDARRAAEGSGDQVGTPGKLDQATAAAAASAEEYIVKLNEWAGVCIDRDKEWNQYTSELEKALITVQKEP